jgi:hypothetical protein
VIERQRTYKAVNRTLRCRIGRNLTLAGVSLHRRQIDVCSPAPFFHLRNPVVSHEIDAADVYQQIPVPSFEIGLNHRVKRMKRGRVDDDVQAANFFHGFRHRSPHGIRLSYVAWIRPQTQPALLGFERQFLIRRHFDPTSQNVGPARREALDNSASDSGSPGDNRDFPLKFFHADPLLFFNQPLQPTEGQVSAPAQRSKAPQFWPSNLASPYSLMTLSRYSSPAGAHQKIKIRTAVRLENMIDV